MAVPGHTGIGHYVKHRRVEDAEGVVPPMFSGAGMMLFYRQKKALAGPVFNALGSRAHVRSGRPQLLSNLADGQCRDAQFWAPGR